MATAPYPPGESSSVSAVKTGVELPEGNEGERTSDDNRISTQPDNDDDDADNLVKKVYAVSLRWEREQQGRMRQTSNSSGPVIEHKPLLTFTIEDFNRYFCCCARRVGSMFFLLERRDGSPIVVAGPCW
eukprot:CAMPEP_0196148174 /NCGR_PEP_ID=MMETSP0910-20130528/27162_1 /TAXON_ID=49265 /ORGANISM="Thalassiosira rotula, Strain GSO102" /LENGTH=128 /DNA_ID=CAMNT_0041410807 /DNA_START=12 /DNA_END=395 /DNA_ORIENTATION=-